MTFIPRFHTNDPIDAIHEGLAAAGCAVITDAASSTVRRALLADLDEPLARTKVATEVADDEFYPGHTRRVTAVVTRSPASHELVTRPQMMALCDALLLPNCSAYQLHVCSGLVVGPGARKQVLHREDDAYPFFDVPRPNLVLASMWAMTDFTNDNGATLIVPGSHRWPADRVARPDEVVSAEMTAGSVLVWLGGTLHGAGANATTDDWRHGLFISYSLGWLRQEENQYLDVPWRVAENLPRDLRALVGYRMAGSLGFYDKHLER